MSIVFNVHVQQRPWRGYDDPGLPVGMYISQGLVTGDASGGNMILIYNFRLEGDAASGRFYNLEQMNLFHSGTTALTVGMVATNWDIVGEQGLLNRQWRSRLMENTNSVSPILASEALALPLFLGITSPVASLAAQLELSVDNVDLTTLVGTIQGYIWEPRSVLSEGGLRRPMDSLYGGGR